MNAKDVDLYPTFDFKSDEEIATKMKESGEPVDKISKCTGLTIEEIADLKKKVHGILEKVPDRPVPPWDRIDNQ
jgi:hypothetical protein